MIAMIPAFSIPPILTSYPASDINDFACLLAHNPQSQPKEKTIPSIHTNMVHTICFDLHRWCRFCCSGWWYAIVLCIHCYVLCPC